MSQEPFDLMAYAEEEATSGGGGGYFAQFSVNPGWFVLHTGNPADRFWQFSNKPESEEAKERAADYIEKHDVTTKKGDKARPNIAFLVEIYADSVLNRDETPTWQGGTRKFHLAGFSEAYQGELLEDGTRKENGFKHSFAPYLESLGEDEKYGGEKLWAQVGFQPDPYKPEQADGSPNLVPFIVQFFDSEEQARVAVGEDGATLQIPPAPATWSTKDAGGWREYAMAIYNAAKEGQNPQEIKDTYAFGKYGVTGEVIENIINLQEENEVPF